MNSFVLESCVKPSYMSRMVRADDRRCEFDCKNQTLIQKKTKIDLLLIGDSITQMWELPAYFNNRNLCIINRGIGGDRTEYLLHRFEADALQLKPELCVILIGINDTWKMEEDFFKQEKGLSYKVVVKDALNNMSKIIQLAEDRKQQIALCTIPPTNMYWTMHENERHLYVKLFNEGIKKLGEEHNIDVLDYYEAFLSEDGISLDMNLSIEGVHPNVFGYDRMFQILMGYLRNKHICE